MAESGLGGRITDAWIAGVDDACEIGVLMNGALGVEAARAAAALRGVDGNDGLDSRSCDVSCGDGAEEATRGSV